MERKKRSNFKGVLCRHLSSLTKKVLSSKLEDNIKIDERKIRIVSIGILIIILINTI